MNLRIFDLHCDTPTELYNNSLDLSSNNLHVSLDKTQNLSSHVQVMAVWSDKRYNDRTAYRKFHKIADNLMSEIERNSDTTVFIKDSKKLLDCEEKYHNKILLSVEDLRLIEDRLDRIPILRTRGVRFATAVWAGESIIGGAYDTDIGLSDFGKSAISECFKNGIIPDVSHASVRTADDIFELAHSHSMPVVATHSCAYSVSPHRRNLSDEQFREIINLGGIVGVCLCCSHLNPESPESASIKDVIKNIEHYLSLGGEGSVALGCDFDGTDVPKDIKNISGLVNLAEEMARLGYNDKLIDDILYSNAYNFINKHLGEK